MHSMRWLGLNWIAVGGVSGTLLLVYPGTTDALEMLFVTAHDANEVVFPCLYGFFFYVAAMVVQQCRLEVNSCG